jgi:hypothetical protein
LAVVIIPHPEPAMELSEVKKVQYPIKKSLSPVSVETPFPTFMV